ncbi:hypothetical protein [Phenylobacterium sp.]|uniref:hypothetical protein n=1 Tax=Phenylobacterium sp. TaxID=1871053 RepID=UPI0025E26CAE|nr:hypothetical protein [Phenylobacterium sp.]
MKLPSQARPVARNLAPSAAVNQPGVGPSDCCGSGKCCVGACLPFIGCAGACVPNIGQC